MGTVCLPEAVASKCRAPRGAAAAPGQAGGAAAHDPSARGGERAADRVGRSAVHGAVVMNMGVGGGMPVPRLMPVPVPTPMRPRPTPHNAVLRLMYCKHFSEEHHAHVVGGQTNQLTLSSAALDGL